MSENVIIALLGAAASITVAGIGYLAQLKAARIASEGNKSNSQAGVVGDEGVRNQVSPRPPDED